MVCCGSTSTWKREAITEHKFDFIDVAEFYEASFVRKVQYMVVFVILIKSMLVYVADFATAYMLLQGTTASGIEPKIPLKYSKWIFVGCIAVSYLLLLWELRKARRIVRSRDIAYAYTNIAASRYYSVLSYAHFCLFKRIDKSATRTEAVAFFIFFRLKNWKRLLLAEAPRQIINAFTMHAILVDYKMDVLKAIRHEQYTNIQRQITFGLMAFTFAVFAVSALALFVAFLLYIPLLCQIRGNLKEYVCHLVDKRIAHLLQKNKKRRMIEHRKWQEKRAASEVGSIRSKKPTLPRMNDLDMDDARSAYSAATGMQAGYYGKAPPPASSFVGHERRPGTAESIASGYSQRTYVENVGGGRGTPPPVPNIPAAYAASAVSTATSFRPPGPPPALQPPTPVVHNPLLAQYREQQQAGTLRSATYRPPQHAAPPTLNFDASSDVASNASGPPIYPEDSISEVGARGEDRYAIRHASPRFDHGGLRAAARGGASNPAALPPRHASPAPSDTGSIIMAAPAPVSTRFRNGPPRTRW